MLAGRSGLSPMMVGRAAPLARLSALVSASREGGTDRPAVALVAGEAGIGKTRLLRELVASAPRDVVVLAGQAEAGSLGRPWDLMRAVLGVLPAGPLDSDLLPAVLAMLDERIGDRPALAVFEDLHWADAESVGVFERLATAGPPALVLVGSYRPDELSRRLPGGEMLVRLERRQHVKQLRLQPLSRLEIGAFLAAVYRRPLPASVAGALHGRTGGNPFFLEELLTAAGDGPPERLADQPLPWSLAEIVARQLDGLDPEERRVVQAAAVLGRRARFEVLAAMIGATESQLISVLRSLIDRQLLHEECDDEFTFRHALVRDAVEGQLLGRERRRLHEVALAALRATCCENLAELARHAAGAGHYEEFVELARDGVVHYLERGSSYSVLALATDALAEAPDDLLLLGAAARASWLLGLFDEGLVHVQHWQRLATDSGEVAEQAGALRMRGRLLHDLARHDEAWAVVDQLRSLSGQLSGIDEAKTLAFLAQIHMLQDEPVEAIALAERAAVAAEAVDAKTCERRHWWNAPPRWRWSPAGVGRVSRRCEPRCWMPRPPATGSARPGRSTT